jgi:hypothetical protein
VLLHDRRIPSRGQANIDHIAIGPGHITVIDTKSARGRVRVQQRGGILSPRHELLLINGRDRNHLIHGLERQIQAVRATITECPQTKLISIETRLACHSQIRPQLPAGRAALSKQRGARGQTHANDSDG